MRLLVERWSARRPSQSVCGANRMNRLNKTTPDLVIERVAEKRLGVPDTSRNLPDLRHPYSMLFLPSPLFLLYFFLTPALLSWL
ncbi:hypothetical protein BOTBODRAFT_251398 [Botryobasidium botryosum FD-172 SS1]|uniref:Uncharacterized protein n=1 Tax=Botryobasidium botryosum (strain FD-172 SS1) TaxID=930990 RepID=A0A067ML77_BOTB1|nr:hypothetical protein BOTBODRAFT_251398 [Botryobasidium botryosum FD-172 SS1]